MEFNTFGVSPPDFGFVAEKEKLGAAWLKGILEIDGYKLYNRSDSGNMRRGAIESLFGDFTIMNTATMRYAGFWPRLGSMLLDVVVMSPLIALSFWGTSQFRLFEVYYFLPGILFGLFYSVYLVRRFGGTPGKLLAGIRIRKLNGEPVGYREAFLRFLPDFVLSSLMSIAFIIAVFHMTDAEYDSLAFMERTNRMLELVPSWYRPLQWIQTAWFWSELIVLLTNRKRRALHDFIAGTVVVHAQPKVSAQAVVAPEVSV